MIFQILSSGAMSLIDGNNTVYQGSNNATKLFVIAPVAPPAGLQIAFTYPDGTVSDTAIPMYMEGCGALEEAGTSYVWSYDLPYRVTQVTGEVGVSINVVNSRTNYANNQTTYTGTINVAYSALPAPQADYDTTDWEEVLNLLTNYYNWVLQMGDLTELTTEDKTTLVKAINEVNALAKANAASIATIEGEIGDLTDLTTDDKETIVGAINEVDAHADTAQATAEAATQAANAASENAAAANGIAGTALSTATTAQSIAETAQATADGIAPTAETALENANTALQTANTATAKANEAKSIAEGRAQSIGRDDYEAIVSLLNAAEKSAFRVGDNIYNRTNGVPDLWVSSVEDTSVPYVYTNDDAIVTALAGGGYVQFGYFQLSALESIDEETSISWQNVSVAIDDFVSWTPTSDLEEYLFRATIALSDFVTYSTVSFITFSAKQATSGNFAPYCESYNGGVYIYAKAIPEAAVIIPTIITFKTNVGGGGIGGAAWNTRGAWVSGASYSVNDVVYDGAGCFVCKDGIVSSTAPENDGEHWDTVYISPAVPELPTSLPVTSGAKVSGSLPTSGWNAVLDELWKGATLPSSSGWRSVAYGNGKFVAVATNSNKVAYSTDGISWNAATMPSSAYWLSVTYGNGKFVAVAFDSNKAAYSTDGISWNAVTLPSSANWFSVTYGNGKFVAVAYGSDKAAYSTDGISWNAVTLPSSVNWYSVAYGNDKFVAVATNSNKVAYSTDGISWSAATMPSSADWYSVTYGNGKFVAVAYGSDKAAYSTDGISWNAVTLPSSSGWQSVTYGNGKFVAVATNSNKAAYSTDGISWTSATLPSSSGWQSVTYGNGKFVALAYISDKAAYWTCVTLVVYTISNASIKTNSFAEMQLTSDKDVRPYSKADGNVVVEMDTVPATPIPYIMQIIETSTEGAFGIVNDYVTPEQVQSNWTESSITSKAFIRNKPTVDQAYSAASTNAQSGTAVAEALTQSGFVTKRVLYSDASGSATPTLGEAINIGYPVFVIYDDGSITQKLLTLEYATNGSKNGTQFNAFRAFENDYEMTDTEPYEITCAVLREFSLLTTLDNKSVIEFYRKRITIPSPLTGSMSLTTFNYSTIKEIYQIY